MVMQTDDNGRELTPAEAEDLEDTLIAISVVTKRLARKVSQKNPSLVYSLGQYRLSLWQ